MKPVRVAVIGAGAGEATRRDLIDAFEVGRLLAPHATVLCGGRGGTMEAVAKGVAEGGGVSVGILPQGENQGNPYLTLLIPTGLGEARNVLVVTAAHYVIAIGGNYGTLSEMAFSLKLGRPIVGLHTWSLMDSRGNDQHFLNLDTPEEAVDCILNYIKLH